MHGAERTYAGCALSLSPRKCTAEHPMLTPCPHPASLSGCSAQRLDDVADGALDTTLEDGRLRLWTACKVLGRWGHFGPRRSASTTGRARAWHGGALKRANSFSTALAMHNICPHRGRSYCSRAWRGTPGALLPKGCIRARRGPGTWHLQSSAIGGHQPFLRGQGGGSGLVVRSGAAGLSGDFDGRLLIHVIEPGPVLERHGVLNQMRVLHGSDMKWAWDERLDSSIQPGSLRPAPGGDKLRTMYREGSPRMGDGASWLVDDGRIVMLCVR